MINVERNDHQAALEKLGLVRRIRTQIPHTHRRQPTRYILQFEAGFPQEPAPESGEGFAEIMEKMTPISGITRWNQLQIFGFSI